jgi:hypothetical protein
MPGVVGACLVGCQVGATLRDVLERFVDEGERVSVLVRDTAAWKVAPPGLPAPIPMDSRAVGGCVPVAQPKRTRRVRRGG